MRTFLALPFILLALLLALAVAAGAFFVSGLAFLAAIPAGIAGAIQGKDE